MTSPLLKVENLTIGYETNSGLVKAVDNISFTLDRDRPLGLVGESGCGKTTIGMCLMGLLPSNARILGGKINFNGKELTDLSPKQWLKIRGKEIAMIFQAAMNALNPVLRVDEQIKEALQAHGTGSSPDEIQAQVNHLLDLVEIPLDRARDYPHEYSGGMKQRAVIAMALACDPKLIIADEPTTALDVIVQDQILQDIRTMREARQTGLIFISHDIAVTASVCEDVCVMYGGQILETGPKKEVFSSPAHPYTKTLLGSYLSIDNRLTVNIPERFKPLDLTVDIHGCRFSANCRSCAKGCKGAHPQWVNLSATHRAYCCEPGIDMNAQGKIHG